jgi:hypothetical protein
MLKSEVYKNFELTLLVYYILIFTFILPVSSLGFLNIIEGTNNDIFEIGRIGFIILSFFIVFRDLRKKNSFYHLSIVLISSIILLRFVVTSRIDYSSVYILSSIILLEYIKKRVEYIKIEKFFLFVFYCYVIQILYFSIFKFDRVSSFVGDPNYTSLFLFLFIEYFVRRKKIFHCFLSVVLGVFTFSRAFYLSLIIYCLAFCFNSSKKEKNYYAAYAFSVVLLIAISFLFMHHIGYSLPEYKYLYGFDRINAIFDRSNYIRFFANIKMMKQMDLISFLFGELSGGPIIFEEFLEKTIYPHNLILGLAYNVGAVITFIYIIYFIRIFKVSNRYPFYLAMITYHLFLGSGVFYGWFLVLFYLFTNDKKSISTVLSKMCPLNNKSSPVYSRPLKN